MGFCTHDQSTTETNFLKLLGSDVVACNVISTFFWPQQCMNLHTELIHQFTGDATTVPDSRQVVKTADSVVLSIGGPSMQVSAVIRSDPRPP